MRGSSAKARRVHRTIPTVAAVGPAAHVWVIAYDVGCDRLRRQLFRLLRSYGEPLQKSVFVCELTGLQHRELTQQLDELPLAPTDRLDWLPSQREALAGRGCLLPAFWIAE